MADTRASNPLKFAKYNIGTSSNDLLETFLQSFIGILFFFFFFFLFRALQEPFVGNDFTMTDLDRSWNPLVRLGLAFKIVHGLAPGLQPNDLATTTTNPATKLQQSPAPLVDIEDVRKFLRKKLAIKEPVSTIPGFLGAASSSSIPPRLDPLIVAAEGSSERLSSSSSPSSVSSSGPERRSASVSSGYGYSSSMPGAHHPSHEAASGVHPFEIGTVGHPILELDEGTQQPPPLDPAALDGGGSEQQNVVEYSWFVSPPPQCDTTRARLEMEEVQEFIRRTGEMLHRFRRWGLPETSWRNKMPWHDPPPNFLAKGLEWPQTNFASQEEKRLMCTRARKRRRFLLGSPPTWSFMVANVAFIAVLVYNPAAKFPPA